jgi:hypothetical protein
MLRDDAIPERATKFLAEIDHLIVESMSWPDIRRHPPESLGFSFVGRQVQSPAQVDRTTQARRMLIDIARATIDCRQRAASHAQKWNSGGLSHRGRHNEARGGLRDAFVTCLANAYAGSQMHRSPLELLHLGV